jgi:CheY-like chemotaxis protein
MTQETPTTVLVVEDDSGVRTTIAMVLRLHGYQVDTAANGFEALECMRLQVPDVVFSDLQMPEMSGFELLSVVRRRFPRVKVIATSGAYDGPHVPSGVLADEFYPKGRSSSEELLELIDRVARGEAPYRDEEHAPVWVPRNGRNHDGTPFVVLNCTECLRSFPFAVGDEASGELRTTPCIYCPHEIFFIIDFSRSVSSPAKRAEWKRLFLKSQAEKVAARKAAYATTLAEVMDEMNESRVAASGRRRLPG